MNTIPSLHGEDVKVVIAEGIGLDTRKATQNSAYNALLQTVGSVMDAKTYAEQISEIRNGIQTQSESYSSSVSEYSQGFIQRLNVLDVSERDGLTVVTSEVTIRLKSFNAFVETFARGKTEVSSGLFAAVQNRKAQKDELWELLTNRLDKILTGEAQEIIVGRPEIALDVFEELLAEYPHQFEPVSRHSLNFTKNGITAEEDEKDVTFVFLPVEIRLRDDYLSGFTSFLDELALNRYTPSQMATNFGHGTVGSFWSMTRSARDQFDGDLIVGILDDFGAEDYANGGYVVYQFEGLRNKGSPYLADISVGNLIKGEIKDINGDLIDGLVIQQIVVDRKLKEISHYLTGIVPWCNLLQASTFYLSGSACVFPSMKIGILARIPNSVLADAQQIDVFIQNERLQ